MTNAPHIWCRTEGRAGRITLRRPDALNALTPSMIAAIDGALQAWWGADIDLLIIDAEGPKAFCAGGDIAQLHAAAMAGDFKAGQDFWRAEYQMNRRLFRFPKPVVSFMQGATLGGGVGVGCHGSHRIVDDTSRIGLPEVSIGLVPDVGGSLLLAQAPGRLGEFLGVTAERMDASDAIYAGFADYYVPALKWDALKDSLVASGDIGLVDAAAEAAPPSRLEQWQADIDACFGGETLADIHRAIPDDPPAPLSLAAERMARHAPLAQAVAIEIVHRARITQTIEAALDQEYRYVHRAFEQSDFLEGIRAALIDRDRSPNWRHANWTAVTGRDVVAMTMPLGKDAIVWEPLE